MSPEPEQKAGLSGLYQQGLVPLRRVVFVPQQYPDTVQVPDDIDLIRLNDVKVRSRRSYVIWGTEQGALCGMRLARSCDTAVQTVL